MKLLLTSFLLSSFLATAAHAASYKLDKSHTRLGFKVRHLGFSNVSGQFKKFEGKGVYDQKSGKIKKLDVTIQANSIYTNEPDRDKHLRSPDFFDVKKFSNLKFVSTKVKYKGKRPTEIQGKITVHGVTKPITLKVEDWGGTAVDPWGNERVAFEASGKLDRREFGLTWNKGLKKAAGLMVGNEVTLVLEVQGIKMDKKNLK